MVKPGPGVLLDLLAKHRVIEDDCAAIVRELLIRVGEGFVGARVEVKAA